nr:MAG TPA: hypothetical protein [Caudoviricetes sp.]
MRKKGYRLYAALLSRGNFANGSNAGAWYGNWWNTPSNANWNRASRSLICLKTSKSGLYPPLRK